jgi:Transcriptional regulator/sugar kinase
MPNAPGRQGVSIGVDIGGTKIAAGVVDTQGAVLRSTRRPTPRHDAGAVLAEVANVVEELQAGSGRVHRRGRRRCPRWGRSQSRHRVLRTQSGLDAGAGSRRCCKVRPDCWPSWKTTVRAAAWAETRFGAGRRYRPRGRGHRPAPGIGVAS